MTLCHYSSEELDELQRLLKSIIDEAHEMSLNIADEDIIEKLYDLADRGERDANKLRQAILSKAA
jgi:flavin reductase (DIM6/NTAB) family NADH-FMN oxidoreductase RutF